MLLVENHLGHHHRLGGHGSVGLYYFHIDQGQFKRVTFDYGPALQTSGASIYFWVTDINGDGRLDILAPGKGGLYLLKNMGPTP